jgi:hypothetical protein
MADTMIVNGIAQDVDNLPGEARLALLAAMLTENQQKSVKGQLDAGRYVITNDQDAIDAERRAWECACTKAAKKGEPEPPEPIFLPAMSVEVTGIVNRAADRVGEIYQRVDWELGFLTLLSKVAGHVSRPVLRDMVLATMEGQREAQLDATIRMVESFKPVVAEARGLILAATRGNIKGQTRASDVAVEVTDNAPVEA